MKKIHHFTSEEKIKWFGYGEWVEEPDEVNFKHEGFKCKILRVVKTEMNGDKFGGHLCGYICIPKAHPWHSKGMGDIDVEVHGGITWTEVEEDGNFWVGFDCGHSGDLIPSMAYLRRTIPELIKIKEEEEERRKSYPHSVQHLFTETYKNCSYLLKECILLAEQAEKCLSVV